MSEFLEAIAPAAEAAKPFLEIIAWLGLTLLTWLWNTYKAKLKDLALDAVAKTEDAFKGVHDRSEDKKAHAIGLIVKQFPFVSEKALNALIDYALKKSKEYAAAQADKGIDAAERYLNPAVGGEEAECKSL